MASPADNDKNEALTRGAFAMSSFRLTFCLALVILIPASAADPVARTDLAGDPLPTGAVARIGTVRFLPRPYLEQVFFTPDGSTVLGRGGDNVVQFWEATTGKPAGELRDPDIYNFRVDQSPDGKHLALFGMIRGGKKGPGISLRVYDLATRKLIWSKVEDVYCYYFAVRYTPDGKHIITGTNADLRVWDAKDGNLVAKQAGRIGHSGIALSSDGALVAGGEQMLWVWDWAAGGPPRNMNLKPNRRFFNYIAFSQDSKIIYVHDAGRETADGYDVVSGNFVGTANASVAQWQAVSPDGKIVATAEYDKDKRVGSVVLRDAKSGKEVGRLSSGSFAVRNGRWSNDGSRFVAAMAFRAWVWDVKTGKALGPTVPRHETLVTNLAFTSDGRLIAASEDGTVQAWDPTTGKDLARILPPEKVFWRLAVAGDGSLLAGTGQPSEVRVWDSKTGTELYRLAWSTSRTGGVYRIQFTADDQTLLTYGSDFHLRAWDLVTGKLKVERRFRPASLGPEVDEDSEEQRLAIGFFDHRQVDVGSDGNTLVLATNKDVAVFALDTGKERFKLAADEQRVQAVVLSADAKRLATAGQGAAKVAATETQRDFQVTVWDMTQAKQLCRFRAPGDTFFPVMAFTSDGKRVVTGSGDNGLRFWDAESGKVIGTIELPRQPTRVAFSSDGKRVAIAFYDPTVLVFDVSAALKPAKEP